MCRRTEGEKETGLPAGGDAGLRSGGNFRLLLSIRILLMKWLVTQGKIAMDGDFRKRKAWRPFASDPTALEAFAHFISKI